MVYIYYWLLFKKNGNLKHTTISERRSSNSFLLFYNSYLPLFSFLLSLFELSFLKKHHVYTLHHIWNTLILYYVIYYIVSEICICGHLLEDCFSCYSQKNIYALANSDSL